MESVGWRVESLGMGEASAFPPPHPALYSGTCCRAGGWLLRSEALTPRQLLPLPPSSSLIAVATPLLSLPPSSAEGWLRLPRV